jgi:hypothetical protein
MGGLKVKVNGIHLAQEVLDEGDIVSPRGASLLAQLNLLPAIDDATFRDKKRDSFKLDKLVPAFFGNQLLWLVLSCIARKRAGLPLTLLELNAIVQMACTTILYALWWEKPSPVDESMSVCIEPLLAKFLSSEGRTFEYRFEPYVVTGVINTRTITMSTQACAGITVIGQVKSTWARLPEDTKQRYIAQAQKEDGIVTLLPGEILLNLPFTPISAPECLNECDIEFLKFITIRGNIQSSTDRYLSFKSSNLIVVGNRDDRAPNKTLWAFAMLGIFYAGIHATAWDFQFPSFIEPTVWRVAVCVLAGGGLVMLPLYYRSMSFEPRRLGLRISCERILLNVLFYILGTAVCISGVFLVVEAFVSVRRLPLGSYTVVGWTAYLPRIGG